MKLLLSLMLILGTAWYSNAQNRLIAYSISSNEIHHLKVPQRMKITYMGLAQDYDVKGITETGLITQNGPIPFELIDKMTASRYKSGGKQGLGIFLTVFGGLITAGGIIMATDDWYGAGPVLVSLASGIIITAGGISLAASRRNYEPAEWQFESLPENKWGERIITQSKEED